MKKLVTLLAVVAALVSVPVALADTPAGGLSGGAQFSVDGSDFRMNSGRTTVMDGGTTYVGLENDKSGTCDGDGGTINVGPPGELEPYDVLCVHYVKSSRGFLLGSPKIRFTYQSGDGMYTVVRITDNGSPGTNDSIAVGMTNSLADAGAWVRLGAVGSGHIFGLWNFLPISEGDFTVSE